MDTGSFVGFDIGGKNVKYAVLTPQDDMYLVRGGIVQSMFMKMELKHILTRILAQIPEDTQCIGVCMSFPVGYRNFQEGVQKVVNIFLESDFKAPVFLVDFQGDLWSLKESVSQDPVRFSASNFFGSAFLASKICNNSVMMDTGSTSTDIIFCKNNRPVLLGSDITDMKRNITGEMTWTGIIHTLVSSLTHFVPLRGQLVRGCSSGATTNDVYNVLYYEKMEQLLQISGIQQKEREHYHLGVASLFGYDFESLREVEVEAVARFVSVKHIEAIAESLLRVLSGHKLSLKDSNYVIMGLGKDIVLKRVLNLLEVPQSHIYDISNHIPGDSWTYGSSLGAALRVLDYSKGDNVPIPLMKEVKKDEINVVGNNHEMQSAM